MLELIIIIWQRKDIYNIASVLSHETGHKEAYTADPIGEHNKPKSVREFPQYIYQIKINPYWEYTTPAFQTGIWHSYIMDRFIIS